MFFSNAGELACDFEAKKRIVIQTMVQPDKPKDHNWNLQRYDSDFQRSYSFSWYISILATHAV